MPGSPASSTTWRSCEPIRIEVNPDGAPDGWEDNLDEAILGCLTKDARQTYAQIGEQVRLSAPAVKRRVDRLVSSGVIRGFTVVTDPAALQWTTEAYVQVYCKGTVSPQALFNGDLLLAAHAPAGQMFVLLGDFTGRQIFFPQQLENFPAGFDVQCFENDFHRLDI